jgi:hypothetical protein
MIATPTIALALNLAATHPEIDRDKIKKYKSSNKSRKMKSEKSDIAKMQEADIILTHHVSANSPDLVCETPKTFSVDAFAGTRIHSSNINSSRCRWKIRRETSHGNQAGSGQEASSLSAATIVRGFRFIG